jgi:hypothetical protein
MIYEDVNLTQLFGRTHILRSTHYMPVSCRTYVLDDILLFPNIDGICHILFIQITTDTKHSISFRVFFGMLWSIIAISFTLKCLVIPWFVFFVKAENFENFKEPKVKRLKIYFKNIHILIVSDSYFQFVDREPKFSNFLRNARLLN